MGKTEQKEEWSVPDSYIVHPDAGIITCVCGYDEDDGFTIQCDHCFRWQHAICYGIKDIDSVPDDYLCNVCNPRDIDIKLAKQIQKRRFSSFSLESDVKDMDVKTNNKKRRKTESNEQSDIGSKNGGISQKDSGKEPKAESTLPYDLIRKKEHLINAKDAFPAAFIAIDNCSLKDPLIKDFLAIHKNDSFILPYEESKVENDSSEVRPYSSIVYSRTFPGFNKLGIFATKPCLKGSFICEATGELYFKKQYLEDSKNQYRIWGMPKRKVIFHDEWPIVIDQRFCGNESRYLRKSCKPNVELVTVRFLDGSISFWYRATRDIEENEELHAGWQWNKRHPILKLINEDTKISDLSNDEKGILLESIDAILSTCECACGNNSKQCYISKLKKIINTYCKSIRSKMNVRYKFNEVITKLTSHQKKREPPILQRLVTENKLQQEEYEKLLNKFISERNETDLSIIRNLNKSQIDTILAFKRRRSPIRNIQQGRNYQKNSFSKLLHYKEDKVDDIDDLSIPIDLLVDISDLDNNNNDSNRKNGNENIKTFNSTSLRKLNPVGISLSVKDTLKEHDNIGTSQQASDIISRSSTPSIMTDSTESTVELTQDVHNSQQHLHTIRSKKKLSFADYKKKLSK